MIGSVGFGCHGALGILPWTTAGPAPSVVSVFRVGDGGLDGNETRDRVLAGQYCQSV